MAITTTILLLLTLLLSFTPRLLSYTHHHHRHLLHQPFFSPTTFGPTQPPSLSPQSQPQPQQNHQPKYPFSSSPTTPTTTTVPTTANNQPFFPSYPSPPPPPSSSSLATFPANISALIFPDSSSHKPISRKLVAVAISVSLLAVALIAAVAFFLYYRRRQTFTTDKFSRSDSLRLYPSDTPSSDGGPKPPPRTGVVSNASSSEFLYLGTLVNSRGGVEDSKSTANTSNAGVRIGVSSSSSPYQKLGSPELRPLPPLPRQNPYTSGEVGTSMDNTDGGGDDDDEEEFFSPRGSTGEKESSFLRNGSSSRRVFPAEFGSRSSNSGTPSYPSSNSVSPSSSLSNSPSLPLNLSSRSLKSKSPDPVVNFPAPSRPAPPLPLPPRSNTPSPPKRKPPSPPSVRIESVPNQSVPPFKLPPPPPPPPPPGFWETPAATPPSTIRDPGSGPPVLLTPTRPVAFQIPAPGSLNQTAETVEKNEETPKPKLKPLHWDKVRASSDRAMVWDQLKSSSFQLNEEMIETLFMVNASTLTPKDNARYSVLPLPNQENRVLDPKKSQNVAILLRALNVTVDEVCEALSEGNTDTLGTELLESLLKMAPTKEEERKLKEFNDQSPFKLGPAEKFLKAMLDIPFAFKRVDAMLYIANFDSEVEYLQRSFTTLEVACEELRNSRMFLKLLEAVLKTGNRMNIGTNRGDAHAFKLDTLLKLVDVRGTDGKTTLLHFVVQEITKAEGSRLFNANQNPPTEQSLQSSFHDEVEFRKLGLQVVSGLSGELTNVKKAASMDFDVISSEVSKLASGIRKIKEVVKLTEETILKEGNRKFSESMNEFLNNAEAKILKIQDHEMAALSLVKEIAAYFHGNSTKEEAHPFRIFMVVRDFLSVLDQVCKEVGKINERTIISSARQFPLPVNPNVPPVFPVFNGRREYDSSDDDSSSSP